MVQLQIKCNPTSNKNLPSLLTSSIIWASSLQH